MSRNDVEYMSSAARIFDASDDKHSVSRCNWGLVSPGADVVTHRCSCGGWEGNSVAAVAHMQEVRFAAVEPAPFPKMRVAAGHRGSHL